MSNVSASTAAAGFLSVGRLTGVEHDGFQNRPERNLDFGCELEGLEVPTIVLERPRLKRTMS